MNEVKNSKVVNVEISEALITKLTWAYPHGTDTQRIEFVMEKAIESAESREGTIYPDNCLPGNSFRETRVRT